MCDAMRFPDTVEEFMERYKVVDTEKVYTNGAELVPIFRMQQWFEHLPSVQERKGKWVVEYGSDFKTYKVPRCSECAGAMASGD